jgi:hypothetical protein
MRIEETSASGIYPELSIELCVAHCRAYSNVAEVSLFDIYSKAAFALCEKYCGRKLNDGAYKIFLNSYENIWLPNPKATNVIVKVKLLGSTELSVLDADKYVIDESGIEAKLIFISSNLPSIENKDSVVIEYESWIDDSVKNIVLQSCLDLVSMMYETRSVTDKRMQTYLEWKLDHLRVYNILIA